MRKGSIGEVRRDRQGFVAEMRGMAHYLNQEKGRIYQYGCDADLADSRCGVISPACIQGLGRGLEGIQCSHLCGIRACRVLRRFLRERPAELDLGSKHRPDDGSQGALQERRRRRHN